MEYKRFPTMDEVYKEELKIRLNLFDGNKSRVALSLGVTIKTIYNKIVDYDLENYAKVCQYHRPKFPDYVSEPLNSEPNLPKGVQREIKS